MEKNKDQAQQGDVLLKRVSSLPEGSVQIPGRILAHGESGNYHELEDGVALMESPDKRRFVVNNTDKTVKLNHLGTHPEHKVVYASPGVSQFGQVVEHDYFLDMERKVAD